MCFKKLCLDKKKDERITVLLGAGACMELKSKDGFRPTTENITNEILNNPPKTIEIGSGDREVTLLNDIYERACQSYHPNPLDPKDPHSAAKVHFEILFFLLETLETYERSWDKHTAPIHTNKFASFVTSNFIFKKDDLYHAFRHMIGTITKCIRKYDDVFADAENDWYRSFWKLNEHSWDLFNLNYDTTIEQSLLEFEDGYDKIPEQDGFQRFNIKKLMENAKGLSTINHIHGCILYGNDRYDDANINLDAYDYDLQDMYKWPDKDTAYNKWQGSYSSSATTQDGSAIVQGPIITGLNKTEKVTCLPYDVYRNNFFQSIYRNRSILIAGYSFGDYYINKMLYRMHQAHEENCRVVMIDYWNIAEFIKDLEFDDTKTITDMDLRPRDFEHYFDVGNGNIEAMMFVKRIVHYDWDVWKHFKNLSLSGPMVSDNNQMMLFIGGMRNAIEKHGQEIIAFLKS